MDALLFFCFGMLFTCHIVQGYVSSLKVKMYTREQGVRAQLIKELEQTIADRKAFQQEAGEALAEYKRWYFATHGRPWTPGADPFPPAPEKN